jgi:hypothetical protein
MADSTERFAPGNKVQYRTHTGVFIGTVVGWSRPGAMGRSFLTVIDHQGKLRHLPPDRIKDLG